MLKLRIADTDVQGPWSFTGGRWVSGQSWIAPYEHPALEVVGPTTDSPAMIVRERCPGRDGQPHDTGWPGDFIVVQPGEGTLWLEAGVRGVAPLHLIAVDGVLHGSWDVADLAEHLRRAPLQERELARQLTGRLRYTRDTLWTGLYLLTERSHAVFSRHGLDLSYPLPAVHARARELRDGADPVAAYEHLLAGALGRHVYNPASTAVELSGGLDSANVAASLGARHRGLVTAAAMLIVGEAGVQQQDRRRRMMDLFGLGEDVTTNMIDNLPLRPGGRRASRALITPYDELYDEGMTSLYQALRTRGIDTVVTGVGGDEMLALTEAEWPRQPIGSDRPLKTWITAHTRELSRDAEDGTAPSAVVNNVSLMASACMAPAALRHGMWPVHPLTDPALIRFGESLPADWRYHKKLVRARLERLGCSAYVVDGPLRENFEETMALGLRRFGVPFLRSMLDEGSLLVDGGYLDADGLAATAARFADGTATEADHDVCGVLVVEAALRGYGHAGAPGRDAVAVAGAV